MEKVILERHKIGDYIINFESKSYIIPGSKGKIIGTKEVPYSVYEYLTMFTDCFKDGELVIQVKTNDEKELLSDFYGKEEYEANALKKDDIVKLLSGNLKKMESELNKITSNTTKRFVLDVAKEIKVENATKQRFLKEWLGLELPIEDIFKDN